MFTLNNHNTPAEPQWSQRTAFQGASLRTPRKVPKDNASKPLSFGTMISSDPGPQNQPQPRSWLA